MSFLDLDTLVSVDDLECDGTSLGSDVLLFILLLTRNRVGISNLKDVHERKKMPHIIRTIDVVFL